MAHVVAVYPRNGGIQEMARSSRPMPLGLLAALSGLAPEYSVAFVDQRLDRGWRTTLRRELEKRPLCVALGVMCGRQIFHALQVSRFVKLCSDVPVVWGGSHVSLLPEQTLEEESIDFVVRGEGEITFPALVAALDRGEPLERIPGVCFRMGGRTLVNPDREFIDLNQAPPIPYHLLPLNDYNASIHEPREKGSMKLQLETARGCPHDCAFCYDPAYSRRCWRALRPENALDRMEELAARYGADTLDIVDDAYFVDRDRAARISEGLLERELSLRWFLQGARVDSIRQMSDAEIALHDRAGLRAVRFGVESGSARVLQTMNKGLSVDDVRVLNLRLRDTRISPWYYFTAGMPGETEHDLRSTVDLLFQLLEENSKARVVATFCIVPMAGTAIYEQMKGMPGMPQSLEDWSCMETRLYAPWLDNERQRLIKGMFLASLFIDSKTDHMANSLLLRGAAALYRPIVRWRMRRLEFRFMPELDLFARVFGSRGFRTGGHP